MENLKESNVGLGERISIKSVSDIVDKVPLEDIDNFITDLKNWYIMMQSVKKFNSLLGGSITTNYEEMLRVNDGKHDHNVNITIKQEDQSEKQL